MSSQKSWICDGVPKNNNQAYNGGGQHAEQENHGPDCIICGLPREAMDLSPTVISPPKRPGNMAIAIAAALVIVGAAGIGLFALRGRETPTSVVENGTPSPTNTASAPLNPQAIVSETANPANAAFISQGEKILLPSGALAQKQNAAAAFAQKNWQEAIALYQQAASADANDPETKIYLNNAKAKNSGNPLTMAVVVPIAPSPNEAKEVLRGVAQAQEEFNQSASRLLEIAIVNDDQTGKTASLADDLTNSPNVLGVLGHGVDSSSRQAVARYEKAGLAALTPTSSNVSSGDASQSILRTISPTQQATELLETYLQQVSETLANYAAKTAAPASVAVFYNSDSPYSQQLKDKFIAAVNATGKVVKEVDVSANPSFDAAAEVNSAKQAGANIGFLALSKNKVDTAIAIAKANQSENPLQLLGGDELYNPTILTQGDDAVDGIVLAVPWSWQPNDPFAAQAAGVWKGRISWRTTTAYDATKALANAFSQQPSRSEIATRLKSGIPLSGTAGNFSFFNEVPLVKAVPGAGGPPGSKYRFDPI